MQPVMIKIVPFLCIMNIMLYIFGNVMFSIINIVIHI